MAAKISQSGKKGYSREEMLLFQLAGQQEFGINVLKIKEIIPFEKLNQMPGAHPSIVGIARLRGKTVTVIDLSSAIRMPPIAHNPEVAQYSIIISELNRTLRGFLVRKVDRIISLDWDQITPPPHAAGRYNYITGVAKIEDRLVEILDVERVIQEVAPVKDETADQLNLNDEQRALLASKLVMIVDDSGMARKQIANALDLIGLNYVMAENGTDALARLQELQQEEKRVDLIISDIEMPQMDGYTLTQEIRENEQLSSTYVLLHTSLAQGVSSINAEASGANASLTKFVTEDLVNAVVEGLTQES